MAKDGILKNGLLKMTQAQQCIDAALQDSLKNQLMFLVIDPMDRSDIQ